MSKERLEGIREDVGTNARKEYEFITTILFDDALWLIEQSERVQELEEEINELEQDVYRLERLEANTGIECQMAKEQNKRYREVIENAQRHLIYAESYKAFQILRKALEELS